ncbi:DnaJ C-terminal domain-containing protein [Achromobacter aloeverae]|uniref:Cytochrome C biogenesis protein n=1 Tax=Achromobacter aloeverae TaxID=1750518 RepID=A0A4Q1HDD7_9BURK|nr:DnaJ C-terminal domain-containing protein [Achromobacter aloeverae]RXN83201.1 cytochrome C biogenesis protein [Achromobacter aloeverae]
MEFKDYYDTLGVERGVSDDDLRRAYRKLARKYHPDVSKEADAEARMRDVNEAYDVLRDPEKRAAYDDLAAGVSAGGAYRPQPGWEQGFEFSGGDPREEADFSEFFSSLFGAAQRRRGGAAREAHARGEDYHAMIEVELEDVLLGATREISLRSMKMDAQGRPRLQERKLSVRVPVGVREGQRIRLAGQGMAGYAGGQPGDLYLEVRIKPHRLYRVEGRDLTLTLPVAPWEAALGGKVQAPTPTGPVEVTIPPGSRPGSKLRLKGKGLPGAHPGDLYLHLDVVWPPADNEAAREAYRRMARDIPFNPRAGLER